MSTTAETAAAARARERIRRFGERYPEALRLARYASLAVSVDAALLRALRRALLPGSDAGVEADLWFSPLTESVSAQGFVLDGDVVEQLRNELAAELTNHRRVALETAASITERAHRHWAESLRLEERATALALGAQPPAGAADPKDAIERELRGMVKAMSEDAARGMEIARWAQRALRRLPKAARETESALLLALGAAERLGMAIRFSSGDRPGPLPANASWILPAGSFSEMTPIGVRRYDDGIEFAEAAQAPMQVQLPKTTPLYLEISWQTGNDRVVQTMSVAPGRTVKIPPAATDIRLRTLTGEAFALESAAAGHETTSEGQASRSALPTLENLELDPSKLTDSAQRVLSRAADEARRRGQDLLTSEHLFIAFVQVESAIYARVMRDLAVNPDDVLNSVIEGLRSVPQLATGTLRASEVALEVLRRSIQSAINAGREQAESFDLFASIFEESQSGPALVLRRLGVDGAAVIARLTTVVRDSELARACVLVTDNSSPPAITSGFFVSPDTVLATWSPHAATESLVGTTCQVYWQGQSIPATLIAHRRPSDAILIRLERPIDQALILRPADQALGPHTNWQTIDVSADPPALIHGTVEAPASSAASDSGAGDSLLWLNVERPLESWAALNGAPLIVNGEVAGQFLPGPTRAAARPYAVLEPFIVENVRPQEPRPAVFISYAPRDEYGKGLELDEAQVGRVTRALLDARLSPVLDTELPRGLDPLVGAMNESDAAAFIWTPVSHATPESAHLEGLALAYRRWVQPSYRVGAFRFRRTQPPEIVRPPINTLEALDLDAASDADLRDYVGRWFGSLRSGRRIDRQDDFEIARYQLDRFLMETARVTFAGQQTSGAEPISGERRAAVIEAMLESGIHASIPAPLREWLEPISPSAEAREVVDIAAMFSFPAGTHEPLRALADGVRDRRAFALNAMPLTVGRALIRRAWIGRIPPTSIVFRDQSWSGELSEPEGVKTRVLANIATPLNCSTLDAQWLVDNIDAPILLIFLTRPLPSRSYIESVLTLLPSSVLFFLMGSEGTTESVGDVVTELPRLTPGADFEFLRAYQSLMQIAAPRDSPESAPRTTKTRSKASAKKAPAQRAAKRQKTAPPGRTSTTRTMSSSKRKTAKKKTPKKK